jgi:hypothetical protein
VSEAVAAPEIDRPTRLTLQRYHWRRQRHGDLFRDNWGNDGDGSVTLLVRTIIVSAGNENALIEPVVTAVALCMRQEWTSKGLAWIEAFDGVPLLDLLNQLRELDLFDQERARRVYRRRIRQRIAKVLAPAVSSPPNVKPAPKPPRTLTRIPVVERQMEIGRQLVALRPKFASNRAYAFAARQAFAPRSADRQQVGMHRSALGPAGSLRWLS